MKEYSHPTFIMTYHYLKMVKHSLKSIFCSVTVVLACIILVSVTFTFYGKFFAESRQRRIRTKLVHDEKNNKDNVMKFLKTKNDENPRVVKRNGISVRNNRRIPSMDMLKSNTEIINIKHEENANERKEEVINKTAPVEMKNVSKMKLEGDAKKGNIISKMKYKDKIYPELIRKDGVECKFEQHYMFPFCKNKMYYLKYAWNQDSCFNETHKMDGSDCSIYRYLTEIEPFCKARKETYKISNITANGNYDFDGLVKLFADKRYNWMKGRISYLWASWKKSGQNFAKSRTRHKKMNIIALMGGTIEWPWLFDLAGKGGPLGELIQWSDLITTFYVLGHNVTVVSTPTEMKNTFNRKNRTPCASVIENEDIDVIYTDATGYSKMIILFGLPSVEKYRCKLRILDSFGTYPEYNFPSYPHKIPKGRSYWGNVNVVPTQILTLYPHTHDNYFLGFVTPNKTNLNKKYEIRNNRLDTMKHRALLYAKRSHYIINQTRYLNIISEYFEIHATCLIDYPLPSYIKNHGPVNTEKVQELLSMTKLFIGVGFPFEGPGPLEAMANGVAYIQPKFDTPINKMNNEFWEDKPTLRKLTSQNPYMEEFVGEPYCFTVNITDENLLRQTLKKIVSMKPLRKKIPREFTTEGFIERVHAFTEYMDYCNPYAPRWPPVDQLKIHVSSVGQSCKAACMSKGLMCERTYFHEINKIELIQKYSNRTCSAFTSRMVLHAPSLLSSSSICFIQAHTRTFSCMRAENDIIRLCPCRDYKNEQSAICTKCLR